MVNLVKGQKVDLTKGNAGLKQIIVGLGWDANKYDGDNFDLDSAAFLLGANGKVRNSDDFVYYNNLKHSSCAVQHMGDNLTGLGKNCIYSNYLYGRRETAELRYGFQFIH